MAVFHPDHDELHGFTVVISAKEGVTCIGRWDHEESGFVLLNDANLHRDGDGGQSTADFIKQSALWGVRVNSPRVTLKREDIQNVEKLGDVANRLRGW